MDFTSEFYHTATVAWACGIISVLCAVEAWRQRQFRWQLLGGVLAGLSGVMCPATLTRGYYEMVLVNQELAAVVAAKRAEGVSDERVQLVRADVFETPGGSRLERSEFNNGKRAVRVSDLRGRAGAEGLRAGQVDAQLWACRKSAQTVSELRLNTTQQSLNGAKLLLQTAANRVRQVRDEIEIVTRQDSTDGN